MAIHSNILAWESPWVEEPGRLQSMWLVAKSRTRLSDFTFTSLSLQHTNSPFRVCFWGTPSCLGNPNLCGPVNCTEQVDKASGPRVEVVTPGHWEGEGAFTRVHGSQKHLV